MNYSHAYHAGNFADVVKHIALVQILLHLLKKQTPFAVIDSHAGRGEYDLASDEALKTAEAGAGIERLGDLEGPEALSRYLALVKQSGGKKYPGSPLIAAKMLRPQDRLVAVEKHPQEFLQLQQVLTPYLRARAEEGDGYARLIALLPPPERRGVILIDPPFEAMDEFERAARAVQGAVRRFATGIFLIWYPMKSAAAARAFCGEVLTGSTVPGLNIEAGIAAKEGKLGRAGLLVLNPPFGFDIAMRNNLDLVIARLEGGAAELDWLRGKG